MSVPTQNEFEAMGGLSGIASATMTAGHAGKATATAAEAEKYANAAAGEKAIGIISGAAAAAGVGSIATLGHAFAVVLAASPTIAAGDELTVGTGGKLVKAVYGNPVVAIALAPATADDVMIHVLVTGAPYLAGAGAGSALSSRTTGTEAITLAQLPAQFNAFDFTANGAVALAVPSASGVPHGTRMRILKTGTAGAITITPTTGTIAGGATHTAIDADNDFAVFEADVYGNNWFIVYSIIA